jgi:pentatricopeptide repeat protein
MLSVLGNQGQGKRVLDLYREMENQGVLVNDITFLSVLHACKEIGSLEVCKYIHFYITSTGFDGISALEATLVHAYGCCSSIDDTVVLFDAVCDPDFVSWAAYISGLATAGDILGCKIMFGHRKLIGIAPDKVMFTSILSACSHTGLLLEAANYFESIRRDHGLDPNSKHYSIMLEAFGRAGDFRRVQNLLENMPMEADLTIWLCLLGACSTHGNLEMAKQVFDRALHMQPLQATAYVMMSNIYAEAELSQCAP